MTEARVGTATEFASFRGVPDAGPPNQAIVQLADLVKFFGDLESHWRGWRGTKSWQSLEGDVTLAARHTAGHMQLRVTIRRYRFDPANDGWTAVGDLVIDLGEQLSRAAGDISAFANGSPA